MYTVNWVDYYYKFFTGKNDVNVSDQDLYPPLSLYPEYVSYIKAEDIEKRSSINVSWEKGAIDLSCSSLKTYTFDVVLSM